MFSVKIQKRMTPVSPVYLLSKERVTTEALEKLIDLQVPRAAMIAL